jgi:hypothetical protein
MLVALAFESPRGALVAVALLLPLLAAAASAARSRGVARALGLRPERRGSPPVAALVAAVAVVLLAAAAARPTTGGVDGRLARTGSQVVFVVDVSRSMLAAPAAGGPTRLDRAKVVVRRLRAAAPTAPAGIAGLTDRILPYVFPTADGSTFAETLERSVTVENPPPRDSSLVATTYAPLTSLGRDGYFDPGVGRRTCVLVTDGESRPFSAATVGGTTRNKSGCRLLIVHVGERTERVYGEDGLPEAAYRADPDAAQNVARLAVATRGQAWAEQEIGPAGAALRAAAEVGPTAPAASEREPRQLAPALAVIALLLAALAAAAPSLSSVSTWGRRHSTAA